MARRATPQEEAIRQLWWSVEPDAQLTPKQISLWCSEQFSGAAGRG
jgi:hypothetical protein